MRRVSARRAPRKQSTDHRVLIVTTCDRVGEYVKLLSMRLVVSYPRLNLCCKMITIISFSLFIRDGIRFHKKRIKNIHKTIKFILYYFDRCFLGKDYSFNIVGIQNANIRYYVLTSYFVVFFAVISHICCSRKQHYE